MNNRSGSTSNIVNNLVDAFTISTSTTNSNRNENNNSSVDNENGFNNNTTMPSKDVNDFRYKRMDRDNRFTDQQVTFFPLILTLTLTSVGFRWDPTPIIGRLP